MKKNVTGQKVGAQMVSATDGSNFTGSVTVYVTLDAGTQAVGSVGSGACTHEGNGYHTYAPAQAETNGDLAAFTFVGTGAVSATVQVYTSFPQTGDAYAQAVTSDGKIDTIDGIVDSILVDTGTDIPAMLTTIDDFLDTEIAAILADTNELQTDWANGGRLDLILDARASQSSVDDLPTNAELATALGTADDAVLAAIAALNDITVADIIAGVADGSYDLQEMMRVIFAACAGKSSGHESGAPVYRDAADTKNRISATTDANGNRTAVTLDAS